MKKRVTPEVVLMAVALSRKRKGLLIVLVLLLLLGVGALCGYMYWASLPPQQFAYWPEEESTGAVREGVSLCIDEAGRNQDGSGDLYRITRYPSILPTGPALAGTSSEPKSPERISSSACIISRSVDLSTGIPWCPGQIQS